MQGRLKDPEGNVLMTIRNHNQYIIGRDQIDDENHLNLEDLYVSRRHGVITCEQEFRYDDAGSRNGSFVNDERLKAGESALLRDGDRIRVGKSSLVFQIRKSRPAVRLPQGVELRSSSVPGGTKVLIQTPVRECREYAFRMMEKNPDPALPFPTRFSTLDGERFEYLIPDAVSLKEYFKQERPPAEYRKTAMKILRRILTAGELLLEESGFLIHSETVFINSAGEIRLLYLPSSGLTREGFRTGLEELFSFLEDHCHPEMQPVMKAAGDRLKEGGGCWDCYKVLYCSRRKLPDAASKPVKERSLHMELPAGTILLILSFSVFLAIYWLADLSVSNLCGAALILAGFNVLAAGLRGGGRKPAGKHRSARKEKGSGTPAKFRTFLKPKINKT